MKLRVWCDSGANVFSKYEEVSNIEDFGISEDEWREMTDQEQEDFAKEIAFNRLAWGFEEI